jgi:hypothetical protein
MGKIRDLSEIVLEILEVKDIDSSLSEQRQQELEKEAARLLAELDPSRSEKTLKDLFTLVEEESPSLSLDERLMILYWLAEKCAPAPTKYLVRPDPKIRKVYF